MLSTTTLVAARRAVDGDECEFLGNLGGDGAAGSILVPIVDVLQRWPLTS